MSQTFRALTPDEDWAFGNGRGSYFTKGDAISADVKTALRIFMGEVFWNTSFGVDWWNLLGGKTQYARPNIIIQCRAIIAGVEGVSKINSIDVVTDVRTRQLTVTYSIDTIYTKGVSGSATVG